MGTACNADRRIIKLTVIAVMAFASVWYAFAPVFVLAQEAAPAEQTCGVNPKQPKCNSLCWQKEQCQKESGKENERGRWEQNKESDATCGGSPWGYCYPPNIETKLQIPIGEAKDVADVGKYIKTVYLFLLGIGGLVGAIVLIHAGFLWLVSGGNTGTIERAKKHIQDTAIGLLLLFGSYTILSAINPDLVRLRVPKAQMLRNVALEFEPVTAGKVGDICDAGNEISRNECRDACTGCDCVAFGTSPLQVLAQGVMWATAVVLGGGVALAAAGTTATGFSIGTAAKAVGAKLFSGSKTMVKVMQKLAGFGFSHPILSAVTVSMAADSPDAFNDYIGRHARITMREPGMCIPVARNELNKGDLCATNDACKQPMKCVTEVLFSLGKVGTCSDGTEGSACNDTDDGRCNDGLECIVGPLDLKECAPLTGRAAGTVCGLGHGEPADTICADGLVCKITNDEFAFTFDEVGYGYCISEVELAIDEARGSGVEGLLPRFIGDRCGQCPGESDRGLDVQELGYSLRCAEFAQQGSLCTRVCESHDDCALEFGCPPGKECACREGRCVLGSQVQEVQVIQNGAAGCDNQALRRCADDLACVETIDLTQDGEITRHRCTDHKDGSPCGSDVDCESGTCGDIEVAGQVATRCIP